MRNQAKSNHLELVRMSELLAQRQFRLGWGILDLKSISFLRLLVHIFQIKI